MRTEHDVRSALRLLEEETPEAATVLPRVAERIGAGMAGPARRLSQRLRLVSALAAAVAVVAIAAVAALLAARPMPRGFSAQDALRSVPRYYMALVPTASGTRQAIVRDALTGRTLATLRPPPPYNTFTQVTGASDGLKFVLTAGNTRILLSRNGFYEAIFDPAHNALTMTPLALRGLPLLTDFDADALSPDGHELAVASQHDGGAAQIAIYSLPGGAVRVWRSSADVETAEFAGSDAPDLLTWSRTGILAFGWGGSPNRHVTPGEYLLNATGPGGGLLADSRLPFCAPAQNAYFAYFGHLTPDGTKVILPLAEPIPPGQRPHVCTPAFIPGYHPGSPVLEEFSATTGKAIGVIYTSPSPFPRNLSAPFVGGYSVFWSNDSGSVLVVDIPVQRGRQTPNTLGVLSEGRFVPIPRAPNPSTGQVAF
jgi:hypothetical protein